MGRCVAVGKAGVVRAEINLHNGDNMPAMRAMADNAYPLAIVDPPYGIGEDGGRCRTRKKHNNAVKHAAKGWDKHAPTAEYWAELFRVSVDQIVWGGNYFTNHLLPSMGWVYWDKRIGGDFSDGELAYTSFGRALKSFSYWNGNNGIARIHPCQKPVALYKWLLSNYAKPGDTILDTHLGSGSIAIACWDAGYDLDAWELDPDYYAGAVARLDKHRRQGQFGL